MKRLRGQSPPGQEQLAQKLDEIRGELRRLREAIEGNGGWSREQVAEITEGAVRLSLNREQVEQLDEYRKPATSAEIEPESRGGFGETLAADAREVEGRLLGPTQRHEDSMNLWRRIAFFFRRLAR
jgi:hypothetical protein